MGETRSRKVNWRRGCYISVHTCAVQNYGWKAWHSISQKPCVLHYFWISKVVLKGENQCWLTFTSKGLCPGRIIFPLITSIDKMITLLPPVKEKRSIDSQKEKLSRVIMGNFVRPTDQYLMSPGGEMCEEHKVLITITITVSVSTKLGGFPLWLVVVCRK